MQKLNLDNLRNEIDTRKQQRDDTTISNAQQGKTAPPKDMFLHGLVEAIKTGKPNMSTNIIKSVDNVTESKAANNPNAIQMGSKTLKPDVINNNIEPLNESQLVNLSPTKPVYKPPVNVNENHEINERDLQIETERRMNEYRRLYGDKYSNLPKSWNPTGLNLDNGNVNNSSYQPQYQQQPTMINENFIVENVEKRIMENISRNLFTEIPTLMKATLVELYTADKIKSTLLENTEIMKKVINENKNVIKQIILETLREIQTKNKK